MLLKEWVAWMDGFALRNDDNWRHTREIIAAIFSSKGVRTTGRELIPLASDREIFINKPRMLTWEERQDLARRFKFHIP